MIKPVALAGVALAVVSGFLHWVIEGPNEVQPEDDAEAKHLHRRKRPSKTRTIVTARRTNRMTRPKGTLTRNSTLTRLNHWFTAACFVLLTISGLSMFHPLLFWMSELFGGGQWTRAMHPWIGIALLISYTGLIVAVLARQSLEQR